MATGTNIGSLFWTTGIDTTGLKRDSQKAKGALSGLFNPAVLGATALAGAILKAGDAALQFSRDFETAFAEVQTISQSARDNADAMRDSLLELTTKIPVQAVDATRALYQIVSAGFDGADAMKVLEVSAKAAVAGVSTTAVAADTLTTIINAYGLEAGEVTDVSDALFKTVELGKTTLSELGASFSQVAGLGAAYKIELTDILAATAQLTSQGASTSEAITRIRGGIVALSKEFGPAVFEGRNLAEAFQFARDEADKAGKGYEEFFGRVEAVVGILGLTGDQLDNFTDKLEQVTTATGSTDAALAVMNDTFDSQYKLLQNNVTVAFSGFGDLIKNTLTPIIRAFNEEFETGNQRIQTETEKTFDSIIAESKKLATAEEQRAFIIEQIIELQKESESQQGKINDLQSVQPGILRRNVELLSQAIGLGADFTSGIDNEKLLQFNKEQQTAILNSKKLLEDYFKTIRDESDKLEGLGVEDLEKLRDSLENALTLGFGENVNANIQKQIEAVNSQIKNIQSFEVPVKIVTIESLTKEINDLKKEISASSIDDAAILNVELELKERELEDFRAKVERNLKFGKALIPIETPKLGDDFKAVKKAVKDATLEVEKLNKKIKETGGVTTDIQEKLDDEYEILINQLDVIGEIEAGFRGVADALGSVDKDLQTSVLKAADFVNIVGNISAGNIGGAISGLAKLFVDAFVPVDDGINKFEELNRLTSEFIGQWNTAQSALNRLGFDNIQNQLSALELGLFKVSVGLESLNAPEFDFNSTKLLINNYQTLGFTIDDLDSKIADLSNTLITSSDALSAQQKEDIENAIATYNQLSDQFDSITQEITGTTISSLSESLAEAFLNGETAAESWGKTVDDIIKNVIIKQLSSQFLSKPITDAINALVADTEGGLSTEEADKFKTAIENIAATTGPAFEAARRALEDIGFDFNGGDASSDSGIAGAIRRELTEETGGLILGQFTAMRVDLKQLNEINVNQTEVLIESSGYLQQIEINTRSLELMPDVVNELQTLNTNLKNNL